ncbi:hypothetical protein H7H82_03940 [Mycobacterium heidelbergense]|uniref:Uncharacterized protein n=1 Tax=Mycobacterium heidelbergense TaxID=53376 RepID=A0A1X0DTM8_MYCHE|nr:hypothetical protein [Mycobacterium heidelbergense]MCV7049763.1 hypothetical protein [Mycobacterium heidelbergense]ORA75695.1 hypothetical protein BST25_04450 [Mycobacterium heidelbergense]BBZ48584.1 hypothetical protein MHEI_03010 [Mycobacterium heidelbergense]
MNENEAETVWLSPSVDAWLHHAHDTRRLKDKFKKAQRAIRIMRQAGPSYPSFCTHQMEHLPGPGGATIWNSYVENKTPQAWRMYWVRCDDGSIQIVSIGPHDHYPGEQPDP